MAPNTLPQAQLPTANAAWVSPQTGLPTKEFALFMQALGGAFLSISAAFAGTIPAGTLMLFQQSAAPVGWTKQVANNDKALRVVSGAASTGGTVAFSTVFGQTATGNHSLSIGELPSHNHVVNIKRSLSDVGLDVAASFATQDSVDSATIGQSAAHDSTNASLIGNTGSGTGHNHPMDIRVQYVDVIIASKD